MSWSLYRVKLERVIPDLEDKEVEALDKAGAYLDDPTDEQYIRLDFEDTDPDMAEMVNEFKAKVRPEVFNAVRQMARRSETFIVA
jgi:hypothetical protein